MRRRFVESEIDAEEWREFRDELAAALDAATAKFDQLSEHERQLIEGGPVKDSEAESYRRIAEIRAAVAGYVHDAAGLEEVRAALRRLFDRLLILRVDAVDPAFIEDDVRVVHEGADYVIWPVPREYAIEREGIYAAGCREVFIGVEAVVDRLLAQLNKGYGAALALDRLRRLDVFASKHPDFSYTFNLIGGHPCETAADVRETMHTAAADHTCSSAICPRCARTRVRGNTGRAPVRAGAPDLLDPILPRGIRLTSFRLMPREAPGANERRRLWRRVTELVTASGQLRSATPLYVCSAERGPPAASGGGA
jgi:hypothetical protein